MSQIQSDFVADSIMDLAAKRMSSFVKGPTLHQVVLRLSTIGFTGGLLEVATEAINLEISLACEDILGNDFKTTTTNAILVNEPTHIQEIVEGVTAKRLQHFVKEPTLGLLVVDVLETGFTGDLLAIVVESAMREIRIELKVLVMAFVLTKNDVSIVTGAEFLEISTADDDGQTKRGCIQEDAITDAEPKDLAVAAIIFSIAEGPDQEASCWAAAQALQWV